MGTARICGPTEGSEGRMGKAGAFCAAGSSCRCCDACAQSRLREPDFVSSCAGALAVAWHEQQQSLIQSLCRSGQVCLDACTTRQPASRADASKRVPSRPNSGAHLLSGGRRLRGSGGFCSLALELMCSGNGILFGLNVHLLGMQGSCSM